MLEDRKSSINLKGKSELKLAATKSLISVEIISPLQEKLSTDENHGMSNAHTRSKLSKRPKVNFLLWRTMPSIEVDFLTSARYSLLGDILCALLFSRISFVLIAEKNVLSFGSLGHLFVNSNF